ncbi:GFA family protein [uncultured Parasphingorhabdus sp.]|uniref:GFA family protein n=1 Tax=uncultured Parasphingorhabdus sp. TaxID=2709694 RepID=UPI0030DD733E
MTVRNAHCHCGQLRIETTGEPFAVVMCHCRGCQQRTGAPYGVGAYFKADTCNISGSSNGYVRTGTSGKPFKNRFCPDCGTTVYWVAAFDTDAVGIAVGCFEGDDLPPPSRSVWESERHHWVDVPLKDRWLEGRNGPRVED